MTQPQHCRWCGKYTTLTEEELCPKCVEERKDMPDPNDMTIEELEKLLEQKKQQQKHQNAPKPLKPIDWSNVQMLAEDIIKEIIDNDLTDDDSVELQDFYEAVMNAVYGKNIWNWINNNQ